MIAAGVPLLQAMDMVRNHPALRGSQRTIAELNHHLHSGLTFSDSMRKVEGWMPDFDMALLSVGEQSGRLDESFKQLSVYYAARASIIRDTLAGLLTTMATLHVFLLVFPIGLLQAFAWGIFDGRYEMCIPFIIEKVLVFGAGYGLEIGRAHV